MTWNRIATHRGLALVYAASLALAAAVAGGSPDDKHTDARPAGHPASGTDEHADEHTDEHGDEHGGPQQRFTTAELEAHGVVLATATAGNVDVGFELPGEVRPNADRVAHLAPRFAGLVREVRKNIGDTVRPGDVLARIESDNLTVYDLAAAFGGVILDKHIAPGETVTRDTDAFIIADLSTVWVEVHIYQKALSRVRVGQAVSIASDDGVVRADGVISYVAPVIDQATRTATARVVLDNHDGRWRPGLFIIATVPQPVAADVIVTRRALHTIGDRTVVFVAHDGYFEARQVTVGAVGAATVSIDAGVAAGERYADEGSFLVKAELSKSADGHHH